MTPEMSSGFHLWLYAHIKINKQLVLLSSLDVLDWFVEANDLCLFIRIPEIKNNFTKYLSMDVGFFEVIGIFHNTNSTLVFDW